jgi:DNA polymerase-3 subunit gamma/tau
MGQALYRKYRSRSLKEIVGQDHITKTLDRALKQDKIRHAYLFTGPRGVGKTSIARILAHEINDLPYSDDTPHIDIIEIDAASNRRIDEIRDLRDKVAVAPVSARYKVYIIDEVHMLTREAFNALLKTLEEPPEHVVFILATTDAHKLPETIISRTQRFSFKPVPTAEVTAHLREIADKEKIKIEAEALQLLAEHGEGSFRDSIGLLDQASSHKSTITEADIQKLLGVPPQSSIDELVRGLSSGLTSAEVMSSLAALYDQGYQPTTIARAVGRALRQQFVDSAPFDNKSTLDMLADLLEVPVSHDPERYLEVILLRRVSKNALVGEETTVISDASAGNKLPKVNQMIETDHKQLETLPQDSSPPITSDASKPKVKAKEPAPPNIKHKAGQTLSADIWPDVLKALKKDYNTLYGVIRMAEPKFSGDTLTLGFAFAFHQKRLSEQSNRQVLINILKNLTGKTVTLECVLDSTAKPLKITDDNQLKTEPADLKAISNIFGGGELLES